MTIPTKKHPYLVYSSVGDNSNFNHWLPGRGFDLWLTYYGEDESVDYSSVCDFFLRKKGAKFPNFHALYRQFSDLLSQYEYVMVADDDLVFSASDINLFFSIMKQYQLSLAQPAFDLCGKVSHRETKMHALSLLRYTSFVEVTCPTFKTDHLTRFMNEYDDTLVGWGADWWFSDFVEKLDGKTNTIAIVDRVTCLNPLDVTKSNAREIDRYQSKEKRMQIWSQVKASRELDIAEVVREYGSVRDYSPRQLLKYLLMRLQWFGQRISQLIVGSSHSI